MTSKTPITSGFILAAGFGKRMMPLTADKPKPMIEIAGRPMIDYALDQFHDLGITNIIINTHYKPDVIARHISGLPEPRALLSFESEILETGGGIKNALPLIESDDFFVVSGDSILIDNPAQSALSRMAQSWNPEEMDILILLQPLEAMITSRSGDYDLMPDGRAVRNHNKSGAYMFTSVRINASRIFDDTPDVPFSYLSLLDRAEQQDRLYGLVHDGQWHHISTPDDVMQVNADFKKIKSAHE
jgi:MurNAc alpha-1-phosphate uridylyltransferase